MSSSSSPLSPMPPLPPSALPPSPRQGPGRPPVDAPERERVRTALDRCLCVEAAAGTGKTSLLLDRAVAILQAGLATPAQLAAITFTELAAAELKSRLHRLLQRVDPRLAAELEAAQISTIHALALAILRERPVEAGLHPGFEVVDPARSEELLDELWRSWLNRELSSGSGAAVLRLALEVGLQLEHLKRAALQLYGQRDMVLQALAGRGRQGTDPQTPDPPPAAWQAELQDLGGELASLRGELEALLQPGGALDSSGVAADDGLAAAIRELRDRVGQLLEGELWPAQPGGGGGAANAVTPDAVALAGALRLTRTLLEAPALARSPRTLGRADRWPSREALQAAREALQALRQRLGELDGRLAQAVALTVSAWLCGLVVWAQQEKRRRGLADFLDQLLWCRDLLRDDLEVRRHFQQRWRYILVDEFQDTDPLQAEIIFYLAEQAPRAGRWDQVQLAPGKLFVVGDPKQSIYRFRRADVETYERAARLIGSQGERLAIRQNFRTLPAITAWVNRIFSGLMPGRLTSAGDAGAAPAARAYQPPYVALEPYRPMPDRREGLSPGVYLLRCPDLAEGAGVAQARRVEARQLARAIRRLVMEQGLSVWDGELGQWRPAGFGDVAVLMPTFTEVEVYEQELRAAGVPFRVVGGRLFFLRDEVRELILFLSAVDNPCDPVAVLGSLCSAFFGVADDALVRWVQAGGRLDALQTPPPAACQAAPQVAEALERLRQWHRETAHLPPSQAVRRLLDETGYRAFAALRPDGEQALANLAKVEAYAAGADEDGWGTFHAFVRWLRRRGPQGPAAAEEEDSPLAVGQDVARVMTVHRAKGLEFPVVFVVNLFPLRESVEPVVVDREAGKVELRLGPKELGLATPGYEAAAQAERERQQAEQVRLYYVAMTRARDYLIVSAASPGRGFWGLVTGGREQQAPTAGDGAAGAEDEDLWPPELQLSDEVDGLDGLARTDVPVQTLAAGEAAAAGEEGGTPQQGKGPVANAGGAAATAPSAAATARAAGPAGQQPPEPDADAGELDRLQEQWLQARRQLLERASQGLEVRAAGQALAESPAASMASGALSLPASRSRASWSRSDAEPTMFKMESTSPDVEASLPEVEPAPPHVEPTPPASEPTFPDIEPAVPDAEPEEPLARWDGSRTGAAFHLAMERAAAGGLQVDAAWVERQLDALSRRLGLSEAERRAVREWVLRACGPGSPLRALAAGGAAWLAEVPFTVARGGVLWEGRIDVVVRRPDGTLALIDYKTDELPPEELWQRYGPQLRAYARALEEVAGRPVTAYLYAARQGLLLPQGP